MFIKTFPVGTFQCNCTILADPVSGTAIIVDPGDNAEKIISEVQKTGCTVKYLIHTHAHLDHIGATKATKDKLGGAICLHKADQFLYDNMAMQGEFLGMQLDPEVRAVDHYINQGDELESGALKAQVIHTPGHTPGSLCFLFNGLKLSEDKTVNLLFSGDTLFAGSIGRTDLWGGDYDQIIASIKERLLILPGETLVVAGHGSTTTIGREKVSNPFVGA
jgi:glyoxylase-like metal-dependent hydrolase (beta-lactamase superfamily II)